MTESWTRRVVTAVGPDGRSGLASDGSAQHYDFESIPGMRETMYWVATAGEGLRFEGTDPLPSLDHDLPRSGEVLMRCVTFPPDAVFAAPEFEPQAAAAEQARVTPELAALFEPAAPGFHTTRTLEYVFVLEGSLVLELDDQSVTLSRGDAVVQNATRHAWRNPSDQPAVLGIVSIG